MVFLLSRKIEREKGYDKSWTVLYLEANVSCRKIIGKNWDRSCSVSTQLLAIGATVTGSVVPFNHCHVPPRSFKCYVRLSHGHHYLLSAPPPHHIISNQIIIYFPHMITILKASSHCIIKWFKFRFVKLLNNLFLVFKQYCMHFYTLFHPYVFQKKYK